MVIGDVGGMGKKVEGGRCGEVAGVGE